MGAEADGDTILFIHQPHPLDPIPLGGMVKTMVSYA
jgi:hypothetical protein